MKILRKLKSKSGESFVEILISVLIVAFGCMLIATMYSAAMNMNVKASKEDKEYYETVSEMEQLFESRPSESQKRAEIKDDSGNSDFFDIDIYGDSSNAAYKRSGR